MNRIEPISAWGDDLLMRCSISLVCGCLVLGWATPVRANDGPPVQRPSETAAPVSLEPAPVESPPVAVEPPPVSVEAAPAETAPVESVPVAVETELGGLPNYQEAPIVLDEPPERPRDRPSENMVISGSVLFGAGVMISLGSIAVYLSSIDFLIGNPPGPLPVMLGSVGVTSFITGATLLGVGVTRHQRWKKSLGSGPARVQLQPTVGFGQIGVAGRF